MKQLAAAAACVVLLTAPCAALSTPDPLAAAIGQRVEFQSRTRALTIAGARVVASRELAAIYDPIGDQPLWHDPARLDELVALVLESYDEGLSPVDYHLMALLRAARAARANPSPGNLADLDVLATDAFTLLVNHLRFGKADLQTLQPAWDFSARSIDGRPDADFVRDAIAGGRLRAAVQAVRPSHWMYMHGRDWLARYRRLLADGGWPRVPAGPTLRPGMQDPRIAILRHRLAVTGALTGQPLDDATYDEALAAAVRAFQQRHRLEPDAAVGPATLAELNVPAEERVRQIRVNLERGRHVLHEIGDEDLVIVDIAGYELRYVQNRRVTWTSRVQVGQPYRQTPIFTSAINEVLLNPTWTVPPTILTEDVLPAVRKDRSYLARRGLEVFDRDGQHIDPASVNWRRYTGRNFPYVLRQAAGPDNALGRIKILFPNPYLVYLHETPSRSLFDRQDRAFSSGCIRVEQPFDLAVRLLNDPAWDMTALMRAVDTGETQTIRLKHPVKLLLSYWTVDEDDAGGIVFRRDVYGRDPPLWRALIGRFAP